MKFEKFFLAATHVGSGPLFPSAALFFIQAPAPLGHHSASRLYDPVVRSTHAEHDFFQILSQSLIHSGLPRLQQLLCRSCCLITCLFELISHKI
jgi:hypothetical protein